MKLALVCILIPLIIFMAKGIINDLSDIIRGNY